MQDVIKIQFDVCTYKMYYMSEFVLQIYQRINLPEITQNVKDI